MTLRNRLSRIYGAPRSQGKLRARLEYLDRGRPGRGRPGVVELDRFLGGTWSQGEKGRILTVDRNFPLSHRHGDLALGRLYDLSDESVRLVAGSRNFRDARPEEMIFLDTETTGLAGGAGTYVFLIGVGFFEDNLFRLKQFFLPDLASESELLVQLGGLLAEKRFRQLVSFNGKSYDLNLLSNRFIMQRLGDPLSELKHLDLLHASRLLWKGAFENCRLQTLEHRVVGFGREGDIPSHLIPQTYFRYLRTGDCRDFEAVLEHNRLDILSMVGLLCQAAGAVETPAGNPLADPLVIARLFQLRGRENDAIQLLEAAVRRPLSTKARCRYLASLARILKGQRRFIEALQHFREVIELQWRPDPEMIEEGAKILEHRLRDLSSALRLVEKGLAHHPSHPGLDQRRHRLECRLKGKRWY